MLTARDIMTTDVLTFDPDVSVREAAEALAMERLGGAPVMLHGRLIGMLSASDLLDFMSALPAEPAEVRDRTERGILDDHTVEEAMSRAPMRTVAPDVPVSTVAEVLSRDHLHRLPVVDGDRLLGIVSTTDVVRALAHRRVERRVLVFPKRSRTD